MLGPAWRCLDGGTRAYPSGVLIVTPDRGTPLRDASERTGNVLVVSPSFFGYEEEIAAEFGRQTASVRLLDERPGNSSVMRAALRLRLPATGRLVRRHFEEAAAALAGERLDLVLVIKGESTPRWFLERLRADHAGVRIVFYAYDRIGEGQNCLRLLPCCDAAYSFDRRDVDRLGLIHKPLFAGPDFSDAVPFDERRYDVAFVGTAHSDRYRYVTAVARGARRPYLFFYSPARWFLLLQKLARRSGGAVPWQEVRFDKLGKREVAAVFGDARAVVDLQRDGQTGLTMRTFEVLASGTRLITSNSAVADLEGIDPDDVLVVPVDRAAAMSTEIRRFVDAPRAERGSLPDHSLERWVREFLPAA